MHTVQDICCSCCVQSLGWKYVAAHNKNQKYKEGKFILIRSKIMEEGEQDFWKPTPFQAMERARRLQIIAVWKSTSVQTMERMHGQEKTR
ncbi:protein yippee-like At5g53940 [Eucalyptus grandis]|uniref:protein yippee-like At5g53940 n=1 Tax=Eucalyptus grandis TaxID=71139 RepID=UPI00192EF75E|nr:protein yippee-like At5g53940 [Eucalyptus grandis]